MLLRREYKIVKKNPHFNDKKWIDKPARLIIRFSFGFVSDSEKTNTETAMLSCNGLTCLKGD